MKRIRIKTVVDVQVVASEAIASVDGSVDSGEFDAAVRRYLNNNVSPIDRDDVVAAINLRLPRAGGVV